MRRVFGNMWLALRPRVWQPAKLSRLNGPSMLCRLAVLSNDRFTAVPSGRDSSSYAKSKERLRPGASRAIGLKFNFRRNRKVQPFGQATGGPLLQLQRRAGRRRRPLQLYILIFSGGFTDCERHTAGQ
jgi:hypothetical protein